MKQRGRTVALACSPSDQGADQGFRRVKAQGKSLKKANKRLDSKLFSRWGGAPVSGPPGRPTRFYHGSTPILQFLVLINRTHS